MCVRSKCLLLSLYFFPFKLICNMTTLRIVLLGCVDGQNRCLYGVLSSIPFNLVCNIFDPDQWDEAEYELRHEISNNVAF